MGLFSKAVKAVLPKTKTRGVKPAKLRKGGNSTTVKRGKARGRRQSMR